MKYGTRAAAIVGILALASALSGCGSIRQAAGLDQPAPDEFAVITKAPLVIPPDYNLRPPKPGAAPTNSPSATGAAEAALFAPDDTSGAAPTPSGPGTYSEAEKELLAAAGASNADHSIRQQIASDERSMQGADKSFTDKLLFGGTSDNSDKPVNADAQSTANTPVNPGQPAAQPSTPQPAPQPKEPEDKKDDNGWFSWLGL
ncbi:MAG TPA: DUF3035 domain-containing protein [Rhizomicrobium sp.]|nr:DUF3035 domain-containing protein [Rhizomicrobium sp.]